MAFVAPSVEEIKAYLLHDMPTDGDFSVEDNEAWANPLVIVTRRMLEGVTEAVEAGASDNNVLYDYPELLGGALVHFCQTGTDIKEVKE